jgi:hypothetical protein
MKKALMSMLALFVFVCAGAAVFASETGTRGGPGTWLAAAAGGAGMGEEMTLPNSSRERGGDRDRELRGTVTAIDANKNLITLNEETTHLPTTVRLHNEDMSRVKVGDEIKVILTPNTNTARTVLKMERKTINPNE